MKADKTVLEKLVESTARANSAIDAIVFDVFGTLISYSGRRVNPYARLYSEQRLPFLTQNCGIEAFAAELGREYLLPVIQRELSEELDHLKLFDDVTSSLAKLRSCGVKLAVCTNLAQPYGAAVHAFLPGMDAYIFSYEVGAKKPDPIIYQAVCSALNCRPKNVLFVGDSRKADFNGPRAFGMQARLIDRKSGQGLEEVLYANQGKSDSTRPGRR